MPKLMVGILITLMEEEGVSFWVNGKGVVI